jgi:hypothetical protein
MCCGAVVRVLIDRVLLRGLLTMLVVALNREEVF